jgi:hypothetical protein
VDVVVAREGFLLAWTDRTSEDPHVELALVDKTGRVRGPVRALQALGGSMLAGLAAGEAGAMLAWEEPRGRARPVRALHLARVTTADPLAAEPIVSLEVAAAPSPELAATRDGFALVASARECGGPGRSTRPCQGPLQPTFVRFDSHLAPVQAEPMFVGDPPDRAALAWGLLCIGEPCIALAASGEAPTPVYTIDLERRASPFGAPVTPAPPSDAPILTGLSTITSGKAYADLVAARLGPTTLVASMAMGPTAPGGARDRGRTARGTASVTLARIDDAGQAVSAPATVTSKALPVGGLALSAGRRPEDGVALGWVARGENGASHVHLAHFDADGRSHGLGDVELTTARGDASDVAIAWAGDGWLVAWVDSRDGNGEVYATRVDRALHRVSPEERITRATGDAGDVSLSVAGEVAWVAWSDSRESPRDGVADVYVTTLRTRDAQRVGDETRVLATAGHSRSPAVAATDDGSAAIVAWIEDAPPGVDAPGAAMVARVDAKAHVTRPPTRIELAAEGKPSTIALELAPDPAPGAEVRERGVRAVIARTWRDEVTLDATWLSSRRDEPVAPAWPLVDLDAPGSFDVALALAGDVLFFDDVAPAPPPGTATGAPCAPGRHRVATLTAASTQPPPTCVR